MNKFALSLLAFLLVSYPAHAIISSQCSSVVTGLNPAPVTSPLPVTIPIPQCQNYSNAPPSLFPGPAPTPSPNPVDPFVLVQNQSAPLQFQQNSDLELQLIDTSTSPSTVYVMSYGTAPFPAYNYTFDVGGLIGQCGLPEDPTGLCAANIVLYFNPTVTQYIQVTRGYEPFTQQVQYSPASAFPAHSHESQMDKAMLLLQNMQYEILSSTGVGIQGPAGENGAEGENGANGLVEVSFTIADAANTYAQIGPTYLVGNPTVLSEVAMSMQNSGTSGSTQIQINHYNSLGSLLETATASLPSNSGLPTGSFETLTPSLTLSDGDLISVDLIGVAGGSPYNLRVAADIGVNGGGVVASVTASSPLSSSGGSSPNISIQPATSLQNGYLSSTNFNTFNSKQPAGNYISEMTGSVTASGPGSAVATITPTGVTAGSYTNLNATINAAGQITSASNGSAGSGTVSSVSVVSANGFAGTVATATTTPAITLSTTITGLLKGNGTAISAAVSGTDYQAPISNFSCPSGQYFDQWTSPNTFTCAQVQYSQLGGTVPTWNQNTTGNAATVTTNANLTGPVTSVGNATSVTNNAITNAMLAQAPLFTIKGNNTGSTANETDLTIAQVNAMLANGFFYPTSNSAYGGTNATLSFSGTDNTIVGQTSGAAISTGTDDTIFGYDNTGVTSGSQNAVFGSQNSLGTTTANSAIFGFGNSVSTNSKSYVFGDSNTATAADCVIMGYSDTCGGAIGVSIGYQASAGGPSSEAIGYQAVTHTTNSIAIGEFSVTGVSAGSAIAIGGSASASGSNATAVGNATTASASNSSAFGNGATTSTANQVVIGNTSVTQVESSGSFATATAQTTVSGSIGGAALFSEPNSGTSYKTVMILFFGLNGTASYTFPYAFATTPAVLNTTSVPSSDATTLSATAITVTGSSTTGFMILEGY